LVGDAGARAGAAARIALLLVGVETLKEGRLRREPVGHAVPVLRTQSGQPIGALCCVLELPRHPTRLYVPARPTRHMSIDHSSQTKLHTSVPLSGHVAHQSEVYMGRGCRMYVYTRVRACICMSVCLYGVCVYMASGPADLVGGGDVGHVHIRVDNIHGIHIELHTQA
jgi:hypothetical protein